MIVRRKYFGYLLLFISVTIAIIYFLIPKKYEYYFIQFKKQERNKSDYRNKNEIIQQNWTTNNTTNKIIQQNYRNKNKIKQQNWNFVDKKVYIYSAYWEYRSNPPSVLIIGVGPNNYNPSKLKCFLRYNETYIINTNVKTVNLNAFGTPITSKLFYCTSDNTSPPLDVTLALKNNHSKYWITVQLTKPENHWNKMVACVRPFFNRFPDNNIQVSEFIAYYQLIGVTTFAFYDYQTNNFIRRLLSEFSDNGIDVHLISWHVPEGNEIWQFGQVASVVDCVYRYANSHEFVINIDVDEYLVSRKNISLQDFIRTLDENKSDMLGEYMFRQTYFCYEHPDDPLTKNVSIPLLTLKKTRHERKIWNAYDRSKCIVRPSRVVIPGIHFTEKFYEKNKTLIINPKEGLSHHYRIERCVVEEMNYSIVDRTILRYKMAILQSKAVEIWKKLNSEAQISTK